MFPLDPVVTRFRDLVKLFNSSESVRDYLRVLMVGGVRSALSFLHIHHPEIDLRKIPRLPGASGVRWDMTEHYAVADHLAKKIIAINEAKENKILR